MASEMVKSGGGVIPQKLDAASFKRLAVMGASGAAYVLVSDGVLDEQFAESESPELMRGLVQLGVAAVLAKALAKYNRDAAIGIGVGGAVSGGVRLAKYWQVDQDLRNVLRRDGNTTTPNTTPNTTP